jgi:hypothetical protein
MVMPPFLQLDVKHSTFENRVMIMMNDKRVEDVADTSRFVVSKVERA